MVAMGFVISAGFLSLKIRLAPGMIKRFVKNPPGNQSKIKKRYGLDTVVDSAIERNGFHD